MRCLTCHSKLKVTHVYDAGPRGRTRRLECLGCKTVYVSTELLEVAVGPRNGAYARARRMQRKKGPRALRREAPEAPETTKVSYDVSDSPLTDSRDVR